MRALPVAAASIAGTAVLMLAVTASGADPSDTGGVNDWTGDLQRHPDGLGFTAITQINSVADPTTHVEFTVYVDGDPVADYPQSGDTTQAAYIAYRLEKGTGKHVATLSDGGTILDRLVVRTGR